jgi:peptidase E
LEFIDAGRPLAGTTSPFSGCDLVYLTGGDPLKFRRALLASGLDRHIRTFAAAGGPIVAASGGAMQLTPNVSLFRLLKSSAEEVLRTRAEFDGIGLVQFEILPHLERHSAPFLARVSRYSQAIAHDVVALADGAALIFQHGTLQYVGAVMRYRAGVSTPLAP